MAEQQERIYAAERGVSTGRRLHSQAELQAFVDGLRDYPWWERTCPQVLRIDCDVHHSVTKGSVGTWQPMRGAGQIEMQSPEHMTERVVLHEVAHVVAAARYGSKSHDPWFARTYLELVALVVGAGTYLELQAAFNENGIDYDVPTATGGIAL